MTKENDVDLFDELDKELKKSEEEETSGASAEKPKDEVDTSKTKDDKDENAELSEEEISKLSPRAQKRIRDLAAQVVELAKPKEKTAEEIAAEEATQDKDKSKDAPTNFKDVKEFLDAVQDEPSRKLLEAFYKTIKGEISSTLSPIEMANNETKFETEFSKYEKIEGLADLKTDLKKTFLRDPSQSLKALISESVTDLTLSKIKPSEKTPAAPNREGKIDLDSLSKDELYDKLDTLRE